MAKLPPRKINIIGTNDPLGAPVALGSTIAGSPTTSTDPEVLLENAAGGWGGATFTGGTNYKLPVAREVDAVDYSLSYGIAQLQGSGIAEFRDIIEYNLNDYTKISSSSLVFQSQIDENIGANLTAAVWNSTTTYALGGYASNSDGSIYKSLVANNLNNALTDNAKWVLTWLIVGDLTLIHKYLTSFNIASKLIKTDSSNLMPSAYIATQAEVNTGTDATKIVTPATIANMPIFRAKPSLTQSLSSAVFTKIAFNTTTFDIGTYYNNTTYRFTPPAGYYQVNIGAYLTGSQQFDAFLSIYKNGAKYSQTLSASNVANTAAQLTLSDVVYLNGTDYIEGYGAVSLAIAGTCSVQTDSQFSAFKIR